MVWLEFEEAAAMACKLVDACTDVHGHPYIKPFIITAFAKEVNSIKGANAAADTVTDNFNDGFHVLREAVRVAEAWDNFWSDLHHNGRPMRWIKITDELTVHGKAESILVLKEQGDWGRQRGDQPVKEIWELHRASREENERKWQITSFSVPVRPGRNVDMLGRGPERLDDSFYTFVFPGLERLGYKTPILL